MSDTASLSISREILPRIDHLARWSDLPGGLTCGYLTPAHRAVAKQLRQWMAAAGLKARVDALNTVVGRWASDDPDAKTLILGSHYDTTRDSGRYAGRLGALLAIAIAARLKAEGRKLPFHLEIAAFADKKGLRFGTHYLASSALARRFDNAALQARDKDGVALADALRDAGLPADEIPDAARDPQSLLGYLEIDVEPGPVLHNSVSPLGVVTAIAGTVRRQLIVTGETADGASVPMGYRKDAAAAAAEILLAVEKICSHMPAVSGTVGRIVVPDGMAHIVPGRCELAFEVRGSSDAERDAALEEIDGEIAAIAARRAISVAQSEMLRLPAVGCAPRMTRRIADAVVKTGVAVHSLPSGGQHDAVMFGSMTDVGLLLVRCADSGSPRESAAPQDIELASQALRAILLDWGA
ncbi:MAG TPA: hydantoinase/carbamoylase family amidase [Alphaproteobacteria bacterium]|nr:hydantoinase/carbamoylase family amidase [Alphaproteobacteria bacterium]